MFQAASFVLVAMLKRLDVVLQDAELRDTFSTAVHLERSTDVLESVIFELVCHAVLATTMKEVVQTSSKKLKGETIATLNELKELTKEYTEYLIRIDSTLDGLQDRRREVDVLQTQLDGS